MTDWIQKWAAEHCVTVLDGFDEAIAGVTASTGRLVYDTEQVIGILIERNKLASRHRGRVFQLQHPRQLCWRRPDHAAQTAAGLRVKR